MHANLMRREDVRAGGARDGGELVLARAEPTGKDKGPGEGWAELSRKIKNIIINKEVNKI